MNRRIPRLSGAVALAASLVASFLIGPAVAATPDVTLTVLSAPPKVTIGQIAGFRITIQNNSTSTISQPEIDATVPDGTTWFGPYPTSTSCSSRPITEADGKLHVICDFPSIKKQSSLTFSLGFSTAGALSTSTFGLNIVGYTTGLPPGSNNSHGDFFAVFNTASVTTVAAENGDVAGGFVFGASQSDVHNNTVVSKTNPQGTEVKAPTFGIGVSVEDGTQVSLSDCPQDIASMCFGQLSVISVGSGLNFKPLAFEVVITFDQSEVPSSINQSNLYIWHQFDDPTKGEYVTDTCKFVQNSSIPTNVPCRTVNKAGGNLIAHVWLFTNGRINGW